MLILLSNDDGIEAAGLRALEAALADLGEVWTVAPATEQSAKSHSLTMHEPLRVAAHGERRFSVSGTPADSVYLAAHHLLPRKPDLVVSGINRGSNLSNDVMYSGTVAAAREAASFDIPSIAVSLWVAGGSPHWETAQRIARQVVDESLRQKLPVGVLLNLNVPDLPYDQVKGVRVAPLGRRWYHPTVAVNTDPRGRKYYWIGGDHDRFDDLPDSDGPLCEAGYAVVTPLHMDVTAHEVLPALRTWKLER
ncbi:MAG: 5'/3'-nucleotidase SurE [Pseudomonadota bacterium]|nr:5'/3'-nucleotidase SurE [Pseudomonadota bacterium]